MNERNEMNEKNEIDEDGKDGIGEVPMTSYVLLLLLNASMMTMDPLMMIPYHLK